MGFQIRVIRASNSCYYRLKFLPKIRAITYLNYFL